MNLFTKISVQELVYMFLITPNCIVVAFYLVISIIIFSKTKFCDNIIYKYLIVNSIIQMSFIFAIILYIPQQCKTIFKWSSNYPAFFDFIQNYLFRIIALLSILINLTISYIRYATINKPYKFNRLQFMLILLSYLIVAIIFSLLNLIPDYFSSSITIKTLITSIQALVYIAAIISIISLNCMLILITRQKTKKSQNQWALNYSRINLNRIQVNILQIKLTKMIVFHSIIYIFALILIVFYFINEVQQNKFSNEGLVNTVIHLLFFLFTYLYILIFYKFNKFFAFYFEKILGTIFIKSCSSFRKKSQTRSRVYRTHSLIHETHLR